MSLKPAKKMLRDGNRMRLLLEKICMAQVWSYDTKFGKWLMTLNSHG